MRNGPIKIILIQAGKYDYAEVDLDGTLQIVGGNNVGKPAVQSARSDASIPHLMRIENRLHQPVEPLAGKA